MVNFSYDPKPWKHNKMDFLIQCVFLLNKKEKQTHLKLFKPYIDLHMIVLSSTIKTIHLT